MRSVTEREATNVNCMIPLLKREICDDFAGFLKVGRSGSPFCLSLPFFCGGRLEIGLSVGLSRERVTGYGGVNGSSIVSRALFLVNQWVGESIEDRVLSKMGRIF